MNDTELDVEPLLEALLFDERYLQLTRSVSKFNLFDFLEGLNENASSRALGFFLDSTREHGLGTAFFDAFMENVYRQGNGRCDRLSLRQRLGFRGQDTFVTTEWLTQDDRRLDILVRVYDQDAKLVAVVGIENKHWAFELEDQVGHYQRELARHFPKVPHRILLFLAPGLRDATTHDRACNCPYVPCSYEAVVIALDDIHPLAHDNVALVAKSLREHFDKVLEGSRTMNSELKQLVSALYRDPKHRRAIRCLLDHRPRLGDLFDDIKRRVLEKLKTKFPEDRFEFWYFPNHRLDFLKEMILTPLDLKPCTDDQGFVLHYSLHTDDAQRKGETLDLDNRIVVQLRADCKKDKQTVVQVRELGTRLFADVPIDNLIYIEWEPLWRDESYPLRNLDVVDAEQCALKFVRAVDATYDRLKAYLLEKVPKEVGHEG